MSSPLSRGREGPAREQKQNGQDNRQKPSVSNDPGRLRTASTTRKEFRMSTVGTTGNFAGSQRYAEERSESWSDRCCDEVARAVDENPAGSLLTAFGAGLGIGVALGLTVAFSSARPK